MSQDTDNESTSDETSAPSEASEAEPSAAPEGSEPNPEGNGAAEGDEPPAEPTLEERIEAHKKEKRALKERMLRVAADFENFRKRSTRELEDARKRSRQDAVKELLPIFDNLERATAHADQAPDVATLSDGLRMVHKQFLDTIGKLGIERVEAAGQPFDPSIHESIQYEHSDEHGAGIVISALQPGYRMGSQLLRPALVVVSRGPAVAAEATAEADSGGEDASEGGESDTPAADES